MATLFGTKPNQAPLNQHLGTMAYIDIKELDIINAALAALNTGKLNSANPVATGTLTVPTVVAALTGNASTATKLAFARTINEMAFDGTSNIVTTIWGAGRNLNIGAASKTVNGSTNYTWTLAEIGVPSTAGVGATGNWGINAATATSVPGIPITGTPDLNTYVTPGEHYCALSSTAVSGANFPEANAGHLKVVYGNAPGVIQTYTTFHNSTARKTYQRSSTAGTPTVFSTWERFYTTNDPQGSITGNAATATTATTATKWATARLLGGVSVDGTANVNLPGVNAAGNQNTTGSAATLTFARAITINGVAKNFDGSAPVTFTPEETTNPTPVLTSLNGGQLGGNRNVMINGAMRISQRGPSFTASGYTLDRWNASVLTDGTFTVSLNSDAPVGQKNSLRYTANTADTSIAAGQYALLEYVVEGYDAMRLSNTDMTLSFWVRSAKAGTHCVRFGNGLAGAAGRGYVATYTVLAANTWEYKTVTVLGGIPTGNGTWGSSNDKGLAISWSIAMGSTYHTATPNVWAAVDAHAVAGQVNGMDTAGNIFALTGVQLEVGTKATPFEYKSIASDLADCLRYFELVSGTVEANQGAYVVRPFKVTKRAPPTLSVNGGTVSGANYDGGGDSTSSFRCPGATLPSGTSDFAIAANADF